MWPSRVRRKSASTASAPCCQASSTAASVFSGESHEAPRWAMISGEGDIEMEARRVSEGRTTRQCVTALAYASGFQGNWRDDRLDATMDAGDQSVLLPLACVLHLAAEEPHVVFGLSIELRPQEIVAAKPARRLVVNEMVFNQQCTRRLHQRRGLEVSAGGDVGAVGRAAACHLARLELSHWRRE